MFAYTVRDLGDAGWRFSRASIILFRGGDSRTSIILFRAVSVSVFLFLFPGAGRRRLFAFVGVKESEIRSPSGLSSVNGFPTYFQLTSNQRTLFRGTQSYKTSWRGRGGTGEIGYWEAPEARLMSIKSRRHMANLYFSRREWRGYIYEAVSNSRVSIVCRCRQRRRRYRCRS